MYRVRWLLDYDHEREPRMSESQEFDVAVIGGGIVGAATGMALSARARTQVVVIEAEDTLAARFMQAGVREAVAALPPHYRMVIVLRYFGDLSYREMGYALDLPVKTVKSRLFTARQRLCAALTGRDIRT